jgi:hypothetical protein
MSDNKAEQKMLEDQLLNGLATSEGSLLDDEPLIKILEDTK